MLLNWPTLLQWEFSLPGCFNRRGQQSEEKIRNVSEGVNHINRSFPDVTGKNRNIKNEKENFALKKVAFRDLIIAAEDGNSSKKSCKNEKKNKQQKRKNFVFPNFFRFLRKRKKVE